MIGGSRRDGGNATPSLPQCQLAIDHLVLERVGQPQRVRHVDPRPRAHGPGWRLEGLAATPLDREAGADGGVQRGLERQIAAREP